MRKTLDALYNGAAALAAFFMVALLVMVLLSITGRQLQFHVPGTDAYAGYLMAGSGFLALAHTLKRGEHIRVTLLLAALKGGWKKGMELWAYGFASLGSRARSMTSLPPAMPRRCGFRRLPWRWAR
jgi:TRAP-type C4-dicarboxylate transport system permease small subunit